MFVAVQIDVGIRMVVAGQEFAQAQRVAGVARSQENHVASAFVDQRQPAQNERPHENLAQFGIAGDEGTKRVGVEFQNFARLGNEAPHQTAPAGDHGDFAGKLAGVMFRDEPLSLQIRLQNVQRAGKQDEKRDVRVAHIKQDFAGLHTAHFAGRANAVNLCRGQRGKRLSLIKRAWY